MTQLILEIWWWSCHSWFGRWIWGLPICVVHNKCRLMNLKFGYLLFDYWNICIHPYFHTYNEQGRKRHHNTCSKLVLAMPVFGSYHLNKTKGDQKMINQQEDVKKNTIHLFEVWTLLKRQHHIIKVDLLNAYYHPYSIKTWI